MSLRKAGFDDRIILDSTLVIFYFNFVNRMSMGLEIDRMKLRDRLSSAYSECRVNWKLFNQLPQSGLERILFTFLLREILVGFTSLTRMEPCINCLTADKAPGFNGLVT